MSKRTNGFMMYMESKRTCLLAEGHNITDKFKNLCLEDWQRLSMKEKQIFFKQAEEYNEEKRKIARGIWLEGDRLRDMALRDDPEKLTEEVLKDIDAERDIVCAMFENKEWRSQPVVICSFSLYIEPPYDQIFLPAEIGFTAFSVKNGVVDNFSRIIDPGKIPQGFGIEAECTAETLGLPKPGTVPDFYDLAWMMMTIEKFLHKYKGGLFGGNVLYVFAFDSDFLRISRCIDWLHKKTGYRFEVKILSLTFWCYLASMYTVSSENMDLLLEGTPIEDVFESEDNFKASVSPHRVYGKSLDSNFVYPEEYPLTKLGIFLYEEDVEAVIRNVDNYDYLEELCCVYHSKVGKKTKKCALALSNRYAFSILEALTLSSDVPIKPGAHYPDIENSEEEKIRRHNMLSRWGITNTEKRMKKCDECVDEETAQLTVPQYCGLECDNDNDNE